MPGILLDHIAIAIEQLDDAAAILADQWGGVHAYGGGRTPHYRFEQWRFAGGGRIEVLAPTGDDGFLRRFIAERGPGIHHVTFKVPSLDEACARARRHGYDVVGRDDSDPTWKEAFLHPKQAQGIVVQLAESHGDEYAVPEDAPDPKGAMAIIGLRLRARSRERAHTQWAIVLGGTERMHAPNVTTYRWPDSPLRLAVEIDHTGSEGPVAIEWTGDSRAVPAGPHPVLGATFDRILPPPSTA